MDIGYYESPCGRLVLGLHGDSLCMCDWATSEIWDWESGIGIEESGIILEAKRELDEYFYGERKEFDIPLEPEGTDFQKAVWQELQRIPYGQTASYLEIARRIGRPRSVRAVANAIGRNKLSVFVPCHRVIGSDGSLTGYRGGLVAKTHLLRHERALLI